MVFAASLARSLLCLLVVRHGKVSSFALAEMENLGAMCENVQLKVGPTPFHGTARDQSVVAVRMGTAIPQAWQLGALSHRSQWLDRAIKLRLGYMHAGCPGRRDVRRSIN